MVKKVKSAHAQNNSLYYYLIGFIVTIYVDISGLTIYSFIFIYRLSPLPEVIIYEQFDSDNKEKVLILQTTYKLCIIYC